MLRACRRPSAGRERNDVSQPLHEIVGEVEPSVITACAKQWEVARPVCSQYEAYVEPRHDGVVEFRPASYEERFLRFIFRLALGSEPANAADGLSIQSKSL